MKLLTVLEAATLVYALFGPESTAQQSITQATVDLLLRKVPFNIDFNNETVEDATFLSIHTIFTFLSIHKWCSLCGETL